MHARGAGLLRWNRRIHTRNKDRLTHSGKCLLDHRIDVINIDADDLGVGHEHNAQPIVIQSGMYPSSRTRIVRQHGDRTVGIEWNDPGRPGDPRSGRTAPTTQRATLLGSLTLGEPQLLEPSKSNTHARHAFRDGEPNDLRTVGSITASQAVTGTNGCRRQENDDALHLHLEPLPVHHAT